MKKYSLKFITFIFFLFSISCGPIDQEDVEHLESLKEANYVLLASGGCPTGFTEGEIFVDTEDLLDTTDLDGHVGDSHYNGSGVFLKMCTTESSSPENIDAMENHSFIILKNGTCPSGFGSGSIKIDAEDDNNANEHSGNTGSSTTDSLAAYLYLCDSRGSSEISMLNEDPFSVLKKGTCPEGSSSGTIKIDSEDILNTDSYSGDIGSSRISSDNSSSIYLELCTFD